MPRRLDAGLSLLRHRFRPEPVHVRFVVDNIALGQVFFRAILYSPVSIIPPNTTQSSSSTCCSNQTDKGGKGEELLKSEYSNDLLKIDELETEN